MSTTDVEVTTTRLSPEVLAGIETWQDAAQAMAEAGMTLVDVSEFGDGFEVVDKADLVNANFVVLDWSFSDGDSGEYAVVRIMTERNEKRVFADGGSAIPATLKRATANGLQGGVRVPKGLQRSEYTVTGEDGKNTKAVTYRFSNGG